MSNLLGLAPNSPASPVVDTAVLVELAGSYDCGQWIWVVTPTSDGLSVETVLRPGLVAMGLSLAGPMPLTLSADERLLGPDGQAVGSVLRDEAGAMEFLHLGLRAAPRVA